MKNVLLEEKREEYEEDAQAGKNQKVGSLVIGFLATAAAYTGAFLLHGAMPGISIPLGLLGTGISVFAIDGYETGKIQQNAASDRIDQLNDMAENGIAYNDRINKNRYVKIEDLKRRLEKVKKSINKNIACWVLSGAAWMAGAVFAPSSTIGLVASILGIIGMGASSTASLNNEETAADINTKIEKNSNRLLLGPAFGYDPDKRYEESYHEATAGKKMENPSYEKAVEDYITLSENASVKEQPKEYVK